MTDPIHRQTGSAPAALYPSDLGNLNVLSNELIANIFSQEREVAFDNPTRFVCRDFTQIATDPFTACLHLENALKEKTALTFDEIASYRILFKQCYSQELPLSKLFAKCPQLTTLDFSNSAIDNASLAAILKAAGPRCPLHTLNLSGCIGLTNLFYLNEVKSLRQLNLNGCTGLTGQLDFQDLNRLTTIDLRHCSGLTQLNLQGLNQLTTLNLWRCSGLTGQLDFQDLKQLTNLTLWGCFRLTGELNFHGLKELTNLHLGGCSGLTRLNLKGLNQLTILTLWDCSGLAGQLNLKGLNQLKNLNLWGCSGLTGLLHLQDLNQLSQLNLEGCPGLADLDLSGLPDTVRIAR